MAVRVRTLGLSTLVGLFCLAVVAASAHASNEFQAGKYPAAIKGTPTSLTTFRIGTKEGSCTEASYHGEFQESASTLQVTPEYGGCSWGSWPVTMKPNGCTIGWNVINENKGPETVTCPAGEEFEILAYSNNQLVCAYGISSQGAGGSIGYGGAGSGSEAYIALGTNVFPKAVVKTGSKSLCVKNVGESLSLTFSGEIKAQAFGAEANTVALTIGTATLTGKFNTGTGLYPSSLGLSPVGTSVLKISTARELSCSEEVLSGALGAPSKAITVAPTYGSCTGGGGLRASVNTHGCSYVVSVQSSTGSTSTDNLNINCGSHEVLIDVFNSTDTEVMCSYGIPSQTVTGVVGANYGSGEGSYVELDLNELTVATINVKYAKSKLLCGGGTGTVLSGKASGTFDTEASGFGLSVL